MPSKPFCQGALLASLLLVTVGAAIDDPTAKTVAEADPERARNQLEQLTTAEKQELLRKQQRFDQLPAEEQQRLRHIYVTLQDHPRQATLQKILRNYSHWLRTLPQSQRAELLSMATGDRIGEIKKIVKAQEDERFRLLVNGTLPRGDMKMVQDWLKDFVIRNEQQIMAIIPEEGRYRDIIDHYDRERHWRWLAMAMFQSQESNPDPERAPRFKGAAPAPVESELQALTQKLSRDARTFLESRPAAERGDVVSAWLRASAFSAMRLSQRFPVPEDELEKFVERLDPKRREYLESLPREQMLRELRSLYLFDRYRNQGFRPPFRKRGPFGPGGPGGFGHRGPDGQGRRDREGPPDEGSPPRTGNSGDPRR